MKVNPIQIGPSQGSQKLWVGKSYKETYVDIREMRLVKRV